MNKIFAFALIVGVCSASLIEERPNFEDQELIDVGDGWVQGIATKFTPNGYMVCGGAGDGMIVALSTASALWRGPQCGGGSKPWGGNPTKQQCDTYRRTNQPAGPSCPKTTCGKCVEVRPCGSTRSVRLRVADVCPSNHPNNICKAKYGYEGGNAQNSCVQGNQIDVGDSAFGQVFPGNAGQACAQFKFC